jgi:hypothetical protein
MDRRWLLGLAAGLAVSLTAGCATPNVQVGTEMELDELEVLTPDSYADRWGDPDEWKDEQVGSELQSTMIWRCLDGEYREMVWRLRPHTGGRNHWVLVSDVTREGECP